MELRVYILPGSEVTLQIGYNTLKSLMLVKAIYEILHVEYRRASFLDRAFSSLCQWSSILFQDI